jgi:ribosomal protein S18 acetylase RimI-like enzyme
MFSEKLQASFSQDLISGVQEEDTPEVTDTIGDFHLVGNSGKATEPDVNLRQANSSDDGFFYEAFASTRIDELAVTGWSEERKEMFLRMQFEAQRQSYVRDLPGAEYSVVYFGTNAVGRLIVERTDAEIHIVDIAILTEFRKRGIGSILMDRILREAMQTRKSVRLFVEKFNPALSWYQRMGFQVTNTGPIYSELIWRTEPQHLSVSSS